MASFPSFLSSSFQIYELHYSNTHLCPEPNLSPFFHLIPILQAPAPTCGQQTSGLALPHPCRLHYSSGPEHGSRKKRLKYRSCAHSAVDATAKELRKMEKNTDTKFNLVINRISRSQWPRSLRRRSAAARLLRSWVRIPPGAWMFVYCECCVL